MSPICTDTRAQQAVRVRNYRVPHHILDCLQDPCGYARTQAAYHPDLPMNAVVAVIPVLPASTCARLLDRPDLPEQVYRTIFNTWYNRPFDHDIHRGLAWHPHCTNEQQSLLHRRFGVQVALDDRAVNSDTVH